MIEWGKKKYGPQAPGIQIGPRTGGRSGGFKPPDLGRAIAGGLNAVGGFARDVTQARERVLPGPKAPAKKPLPSQASPKARAYGPGGRSSVMPNKPKAPPKPPAKAAAPTRKNTSKYR